MWKSDPETRRNQEKQDRMFYGAFNPGVPPFSPDNVRQMPAGPENPELKFDYKGDDFSEKVVELAEPPSDLAMDAKKVFKQYPLPAILDEMKFDEFEKRIFIMRYLEEKGIREIIAETESMAIQRKTEGKVSNIIYNRPYNSSRIYQILNKMLPQVLREYRRKLKLTK